MLTDGSSGSILTLAQWLSPSFPVGAFAFSHGLETAIQDGLIFDADTLRNWLLDLLTLGSGRSDVVLLSAAYHATKISEVEAISIAYQPSRERQEEVRQLGSAFCRTVREVWKLDVPDLTYPVAVGHAARLQSLPLENTAALYAQAFVGNLVSAAVRLIPLGQTEGQAVLAGLQPEVQSLGRQAPELSLSDLSNAAFLSDIQSMRHETQFPRIFQS